MSSPKKTSQSLRVKDTLKRDARRGIARIDARLTEKLGISICDLISTKANYVP